MKEGKFDRARQVAVCVLGIYLKVQVLHLLQQNEGLIGVVHARSRVICAPPFTAFQYRALFSAPDRSAMARGRRGRNGGDGGSRATPYEGAREGRNRRRGGGDGESARGRGKGRGGRRGGDKPKPKTAEELDAEMDSYWGKSEEHAAKKLDSDMDDYWKNKDDKLAWLWSDEGG
jgi:hypothetical protein